MKITNGPGSVRDKTKLNPHIWENGPKKWKNKNKKADIFAWVHIYSQSRRREPAVGPQWILTKPWAPLKTWFVIIWGPPRCSPCAFFGRGYYQSHDQGNVCSRVTPTCFTSTNSLKSASQNQQCERKMLLISVYRTDPLLLGSHRDLVQKVLLHERPHSVVYDDHLGSLSRGGLIAQSKDSVAYRPVTGRAARHHSDSSVLEPLDDVCHRVCVLFGNNDHDALDPRHPAGTHQLLSNACLERWNFFQFNFFFFFCLYSVTPLTNKLNPVSGAVLRDTINKKMSGKNKTIQ